MWDGDTCGLDHRASENTMASSEPAVWDGDPYSSKQLQGSLNSNSEPTGWDGEVHLHTSFMVFSIFRSKPTAWDGDINSLGGSYTGYSFVLSPPCGMVTVILIKEKTHFVKLLVPSPPCGMMTKSPAKARVLL